MMQERYKWVLFLVMASTLPLLFYGLYDRGLMSTAPPPVTDVPPEPPMWHSYMPAHVDPDDPEQVEAWLREEVSLSPAESPGVFAEPSTNSAETAD